MGELSKRGGEGGRPAKKAPGKQVPGKKAPGKKAPGKQAPGKKVPGKKAPGKKAPGKKVPGKKAPGKKVPSAPTTRSRAGAPRMRAIPAPPTDPLVVLGLGEDYTRSELRRAWREYAARHHPDQGGDGSTFARGRAAYEILRTLLEERG
jgi:hypothetical protein